MIKFLNRTVFILNGPNINELGTREPTIYGRETLIDIKEACYRYAYTIGLIVDFRQSNYEGDLITWIQEACYRMAGIILNAGAYTHTSVAIPDALRISKRPVIEVHLSNIHAREPFRCHSYITPVAVGLITGFGSHSYKLAIEGMAALLASLENNNH